MVLLFAPSSALVEDVSIQLVALLAPDDPFLNQLYVRALVDVLEHDVTWRLALPPVFGSDELELKFTVATQPVGAPGAGGVLLAGTQVRMVPPPPSIVAVKLSQMLSVPTT